MDQSKIENTITIVRALINQKFGDETPSESDIVETVMSVKGLANLTDEEAEETSRQLLSIMGHHMDVGVMLSSEHKSWYYSRTKDVDLRFTKRNLKYQDQYRHLPPKVIATIDQVTSSIMDQIADPTQVGSKRLGLVMGDVQSGKTNTYTTLCCKAADMGYRVIILLTGTLEILRKQTQARLDEGLVGKDSAAFIKKEDAKNIGVGYIDATPSMVVFTSTEGDFNSKKATGLNISVDNLNVPLLLVLKKNSKVLKNLNQWLSVNTSKRIEAPLLLIDDEADNASIDTSGDNQETTAVNSSIRDILGMFVTSTYVAFTATPFANIFIDPEADDDLYPRHFIYCLSSPDNYIGPQSMYSESGRYRSILRTIPVLPASETSKGGLEELPYDHSKDYEPQGIPPSLEEAINCFLLSCAVRDIRGNERNHMSMLVNMSRFTNVQNSVKDLVYDYVYNVKQALEAYSSLPEKEALKHRTISGLKLTWDREYSHLGYEWSVIQHQLSQSVKPIDVRAVNQTNGPKNLNYADTPDGLRVIAVGGNSLSRGLTLEGLCVSYFYRRSQTYDTLMQMGRWFGYRDGYDDLCRVWMTEESIEWYEGICEATEELKWEFRVMSDRGMTPSDFGFRVRNNVTGLLITARNKMRSAGEKYITKRIDATPLWTSSIYYDDDHVKINNTVVTEFITCIDRTIPRFYNKATGNWVWRRVSTEEIVKFLDAYKFPEEENVLFDKEAILETFSSGKFPREWDVAIQHGDSSRTYEIEGIQLDRPIRLSVRNNVVINRSNEGVLRFKSAALMSSSNMREGIYTIKDGEEVYDSNKVAELEKNYRNLVRDEKIREGKDPDKVAVPPKAYLMTTERRPLLLIYPIEVNGDSQGDDAKEIAAVLGGRPTIGVALGFPEVEDARSDEAYVIRYKTTAVYNKIGDNPDLDEEVYP